MKHYLITGGAGFIGSNFIHYMQEKYKDKIFILNLDKLTYAGNLDNLRNISYPNNYRFIQGDICDINCLESIFSTYNIDYAVNFAAESHVDRSIKDPSEFIKTNVLGAQILLDVSKRHWSKDGIFEKGRKYLQVSTDEVYGSLGGSGFFTEKSSIEPHSPYSSSKASSDLIVKSYFDTYGMPVNITRCSNNYGPYQFPEKLIPLVINNCLNGRKIPVYGDGKNVRDWIYVEDHCKAIDMVINKGIEGEVYNIGGHSEKQNIELVNLIIGTLGEMLPISDSRRKSINEKLITFVEDRNGHDRRYAIDSSKIEIELGWNAETDFEEGIKKTLDWYLNNQAWLNNVVSGKYLKYYDETYGKKIGDAAL